MSKNENCFTQLQVGGTVSDVNGDVSIVAHIDERFVITRLDSGSHKAMLIRNNNLRQMAVYPAQIALDSVIKDARKWLRHYQPLKTENKITMIGKMLTRQINYFGETAKIACDGNCCKAWGINNRPRVQISDLEDDILLLSDFELDVAPSDPGTYEGEDAKPRTPDVRLNKWCVRECERSTIVEHGEDIVLPVFTTRLRNMPLST